MSPTTPAFSLLSRPHSPARARRALFPAGRGDYKLILPGAPPPAPRHQTAYGTDSPCRCGTPAGGLPSLSPTTPACSLPFCPPSPKGKDSPLPALAERSSRREGGDYKFILPGASPLASRGLDGARHGLNLRGKYPGGGLALLVAGSPATATPGGVGQTKRGP